jgi:hypothetical protein
MATIKQVPIKAGPPRSDAERVDTLQEAIDLAWGTPGHIHEGEGRYYVCDCLAPAEE